MTNLAPFAKTVVWRHPCDCESASRPLAEGEQAEHRFDVDGAPFPYHIAEAGATFARAGGVYLVNVLLYPLLHGNNELLDFRHRYQEQPRFAGVNGVEHPFPWALYGPLVYTYDDNHVAAIDLTFIAQHVDTDTEITEET